jgi:hypothetical protein
MLIHPLGTFLPKLLESGQCLIFNDQMKQQHSIIRQKGSKKTGTMTSSGSTLYFFSALASVPRSLAIVWCFPPTIEAQAITQLALNSFAGDKPAWCIQWTRIYIYNTQAIILLHGRTNQGK